MSKKLLISIILIFSILIILPSALSDCTITFDADSYVEGEVSTADGICSSPNEKSQIYTMNFTNFSGFVIFSVTGTTPSVKDTLFSRTFTINDTYVASYGSSLNVTLSGTNLEGTDNATVSVAGSSNLIITDIVITSSFLVGKFGALDFRVTESNGDAVSNAQCIIDIVDENDLPLAPSGGIDPVPSQGDGKILYSLHFDETFVEEGGTYKWDIACTCFNATGLTSADMGVCYDGTNGQRISVFKHGETQFPFTMDSWLTVNTVTDKNEYIPRQTIFICANVTNSRTKRDTLHIFHQVRCSAGAENDADLDRSLIITDGLDYDERGISANTTQMQCKEFIIPEIRHLEGKSSECYATTTTWVMNENNEKIKGYATTSPVFNITSDTINLPVDWREISDNKFLSIINLSASEYDNWNGTGTGTIDIFLNSLKGESFDPRTTRSFPQIDFSSFLGIRQIKEIVVCNITDNISHNLEFLEDGHLEIEITNQDISPSGWYNITIEFEDFDKRQTEALENISTKTGTFRLSLDCPSSATIGETITCEINAQIEDTQQVSKEVDFDCWLDVNGVRTSEVNFNQMITRDLFTVDKTFNLPTGIEDNIQYVIRCNANYYNLGSRTDSFSDTFLLIHSGGASRVEEVGFFEEFVVDEYKQLSPFVKFFIWLIVILCFLIIICWIIWGIIDD